MAILGKLKEILGLGGESAERSTDTEVTVEREPEDRTTEDQPAAGSAGPETEPEPETPDDEEAVAEETEAAASTGSMVDEGTSGRPEHAAEPAEAAGPESDDVTIDEDAADGTPVDQIKGIGPAYAERLGEAGIDTVEELAAADADEVAAGTNVGESRAATWIDRAKEF